MDAEEFRRLGHQLIDWIADYREGLPERPVMSLAQPGEIRARFEREPPVRGGGAARLLPELEARILPGITHWNHPRFFAYFPSNTSYASVLADLLSAGLGVQGMSWQTSPAATELEEVVLDWLRQMLGLSAAWTGVIQDTASTATLCALLCARERASSFAQMRGGLQGGGPRLTVYASDQAHSSVEKAALLAGFGKDHLRLVPTDERHALEVPALAQALARDQAAGCVPAAIVAAAGTTATTAFDPLSPIAELAARTGAWLHVDAAMAGSAMVLPECRPLWAGVEGADSLVLNPHKWMGAGFDLSAYYVRDPQHLIRVMSTNPSYLATAQDGAVKNYRDWHLQLGRRFRALKLWAVLLDQGVEGLQARLRRDLANARWLADQLASRPGWRILAPVALQTVCLRHEPEGMGPVAADQHNRAIADRVNQSGEAYVTPSALKGRLMIRASVGAERTERADVERLRDALLRAAAG